MQAYGSSFSAIRNDYPYEIPFFQRRYVWNEENWRELLESLSNKDDCPFLGSIILKKKTDIDGNIISWEVIDGQQRLTTLSILMCVCFEELAKSRDDDCYKIKVGTRYRDTFVSMVEAPFYETVYIKNCSEIKIKHSYFDRKIFEKVVRAEIDTDKDLNSRIFQCYSFFKKELDGKKEQIGIIWNYLTKKIVRQDEKGKYLVVIELDSKENEQAIFDTINSTGVRLTLADTIKNSLFQKYIELLEKEKPAAENAQNEVLKAYNEYWKNVFSKDEESIEYWNKERTVGRIKRDNIEMLLHSIAVIKGFFDPSSDKMENLHKCYKEHFSSLSLNEIREFIEEICDFAKLYKDHLEESEYYEYDSENPVPRLMHIINVLDVSTFMPYILFLLKNKESNDKFVELERYILLHTICGETTKNYNKECIQLIKGTTISSLLANCSLINKDNFLSKLQNLPKVNRLQTLLLFWIELYKRSITDKISNKRMHYQYTLEHIMPQKWYNYWDVSSLPVYDTNGKIVTIQSYAENLRANAVYELGNMTILPKKLNSSLSNDTFKNKVKGFGRREGMESLADCLITREIFANIDWDDETSSIWDERKIRKRTKELIENLYNIWHFDDVLN